MANQPHIMSFPIEDALMKTYKLRSAVPTRKAVEVSVPRDFIRAIARRNALSYEEFVERCKVTVYYGGGDSLLYQFELNGKE